MANAESLPLLLKELRLSAMQSVCDDLLSTAKDNHWSYERFVAELCEQEINARYERRIQRFLKASKLPAEKRIETFNFDQALSVNQAQIQSLSENTSWVDQAENLLLFGPSGVGKTHLASAIGHSQINLEKRVYFISTMAMVQQLERAKKEHILPEALTRLDKFDLLILDDIGYVKKTDSETSVLFELIAHRYEASSLLITANQPFSQWDKIFTDNMMAVAAIDRLIHHATVINIEDESYRKKQSGKRR